MSKDTYSYLQYDERFITMLPERIRLLIANFTLAFFHPTLTILRLYSSLSSPAASTNQRPPCLNQSALACFNVTCAYKYHDICSLIPI